MPVEFLSGEWVRALDAAARRAPGLGAATDDALLIQEEVDGPDGATCYHVRIGGGDAFVRSGPAPDGSVVVRIHQDRPTAVAIAAGTLSAQRAFMTGRLQIGGDLAVLLEHAEALALLGDVFADVRAQTVLENDGPASAEGGDDA